ncbi:MAG: UbiA family prenyltransferase [Myxococcales bacterium]|nr:UbiA family prenyltransferase [Myxococcales bacterium]
MRPWLELIRLPAVFTAPADVLAGLALAAFAGHATSPLIAVALVLASAAVYCAGMAANDVFDAAIDASERPRRPIPSGRVSPAGAWMLIGGLQATALATGAWISPSALAAVGATIAATYLYNAVLKNTPVGPAAMGLCRYGNACIGLAPLGFGAPTWMLLIPLGTLAYVTALTTVSRYEVDGATRAQLGGPFAAMFILAATPAIWALGGWLPRPWAAAAVVLVWLWLIGPIRRAWSAPAASSVRGVVMAGIYGIALINGALALAAGGDVYAAVAVGLLIPGRRFGRWFYAT